MYFILRTLIIQFLREFPISLVELISQLDPTVQVIEHGISLKQVDDAFLIILTILEGLDIVVKLLGKFAF